MTAPRAPHDPTTGPPTTRPNPVATPGSYAGRSCRSQGAARAARRSTWAAARASRPPHCWARGGTSTRSTANRPPGPRPQHHGRCGGRQAERRRRAVRAASRPAARRPALLRVRPPYARPDDFSRVWAAVRRGLQPRAWLAVNLFGVDDSFAGTIDGTFLTRDEAEALFDGLDLVAFREENEDGPAFSGPKHWHVFDVIARAPR
ncbi:hypothetical protein NKG05_08320 [Oerskovia sp. M15]